MTNIHTNTPVDMDAYRSAGDAALCRIIQLCIFTQKSACRKAMVSKLIVQTITRGKCKLCHACHERSLQIFIIFVTLCHIKKVLERYSLIFFNVVVLYSVDSTNVRSCDRLN